MNNKTYLWIIAMIFLALPLIQGALNDGVFFAFSGANTTDKSFNNHNLTLVGATLDTTTYLVDGGSIAFDGNDYARINNSMNNAGNFTALSGNNSFTICTIAYITSLENFDGILSNVDTGSAGFVMSTGNNIAVNTNLSSSIYGLAGTRYDYFSRSPNASSWFSYCVVRNNQSRITTYFNNTKTVFDGVPAGASITTSAFQFIIGAWYTGGRWLTGNINQMVGWTRALNDSEQDEYWNNGNFKSYPFAANLYTTTLSMLNRYDNSTINYFLVTAYNSTHTHYANATAGIVSFTNLTGVYTLNVTIPGYYESFKQINVNISSSMSLTNYSIQSLFNVSVKEIVSNNSLSNFNASLPSYLNTTSGNSLLLITNNVTQNITISKGGYFSKTYQAQATSGQITLFEGTGLYTNKINITALQLPNNNTISTFNISAYNPLYDFWINLSVTNGNAILNLTENLNYTIYFNAASFEYKNATFTLNSTDRYTNYTFYVYEGNTFNINFKDEITKTTINNVSLELISDIFSGNYSTTNGTMYINLLIPTDYIMRYYANGFDERFYYVTLDDREYQNITLYLLSNSSSSSITLNVYNQNNEALTGATIYAYRYDLTTNDYILVEMARVSNAGLAYMNLEQNSEFYKFLIYYNGQLVFTSESDYIRSSTLNFQVQLSSFFGQNEYQYITNDGNVTFNNLTDTFTFIYLTQSATRGCLDIYQTRNNGSKVLYSTECLSSISGIINTNVTRINNTLYEAYGYSYFGSLAGLLSYKSVYFSSFPSFADDENFGWMILIHLIFLGMFLYDPIIAILVQALPPVVFSSLGAIALSKDIVMAWVTLCFIIAMFVARRR